MIVRARPEIIARPEIVASAWIIIRGQIWIEIDILVLVLIKIVLCHLRLIVSTLFSDFAGFTRGLIVIVVDDLVCRLLLEKKKSFTTSKAINDRAVIDLAIVALASRRSI